MSWKTTIAAAGLVTLAVQPLPALAGAGHSETKPDSNVAAVTIPPVDPERAQKARAYFTDLPVVTQNGETLRFYSDVLENQIVLVSLFYTECTGMCPLTNAKLAEVQDLLGDQLGHGVRIVSITLDPETDTPEVIKDYAANFNAREGWLFLTGKPEDLKTIAYRLGQTSGEIETHNPYIMAGNVNRAQWTKLQPNLPPAAVASRVQLMTMVAGE